MKIKNLILIITVSCIPLALQATLKITNKSRMNLEFNTKDSQGLYMLRGNNSSVLFYYQTPKNLAVRHVKTDGSKGPWYSLAGHLLQAWGQKVFTTEFKTQGNLVIYDSTKYNPLGWNIEVFAN